MQFEKVCIFAEMLWVKCVGASVWKRVTNVICDVVKDDGKPRKRENDSNIENRQTFLFIKFQIL